jgi:phage tail sheath protein FI
MVAYLTPGVYFEPVDASRGRITAIRTDIAAFIGLAERGPLHRPWRVESWRQFQSVFGDFMAGGYLAYSVKAFFENGGRRCYLVRTAATDATVAFGELLGRDGLPTLRVSATSPGRWGNRLQVRLSGGRSEATQTVGPQPPAGDASEVASVVGFVPGMVVRLSQVVSGIPIEAFAVIESVSYTTRRVIWQTPLVLGPGGLDLSVGLYLETMSFTLSVYEQGKLRIIYPDLTLGPSHERYVERMLGPLPPAPFLEAATPPPPIEIEDLHAGVPADFMNWWPDSTQSSVQFSQGVLSLAAGTDGLANLHPLDFTGDLSLAERTGLRTLELLDEVSIVAIPDILIQPEPPTRFDPLPDPRDPCLDDPPLLPVPLPSPPAEQPPQFDETQIFQVQQALVSHCETMGERFALLDPLPEFPATVVDPSQVLDWRSRFDTSYAALYYPWLLVVDPLQLGGKVVRAIPPSGHVAGVIARTDLEVGPHKAAANAVALWTQGLTLEISGDWQAILNPRHVNCFRNFSGRGLRVYGARTLSSDPAWRYITVRRTVLMIKRALFLSLQWVVFETHDIYLRELLKLAIASFLGAIWQRGALVGETTEQAFFVHCNEENNPPDTVALGQLYIEVGVALVRPAEFIVFRIGRTEDELQITELSGAFA